MSFKLSEETVDALLDKLSSDDDFREKFQKNPRKALGMVGHRSADDDSVVEGAWMCMSVKQLASKESIKASRESLRTQLLSSRAAYMPIHMDASKS